LTFDLLTLKVVSESPLPILVFLGLSVLDLGPTYATERQTSDVRSASSLNAPYPRGGGIIDLYKSSNAKILSAGFPSSESAYDK